MISTLRKALFNSIFLIAFLFTTFQVTAQDYLDDPQYDRVPQWVFDSLANQREITATTVVTIDGWDNFKMGTDFAEGHISENPLSAPEYFNCFNTTAAHHTEDGLNFNNTTVSWGASMWGDPVSAYDSVGNLYFMNMYGSGTIQGCKVATSSNNGQSWSSVATAIAGVDKNWLCADQTDGPYSNYVYCTMTSNGGGNLSRSTDQGATFTNTATFSTQSLPGMMVCVGPNGNTQGGSVYVVTNGGSTTNSTYTFYRSTTGGQGFSQMSSQNWAGYVGTFVNSRHSVENMRTRPYPFITADNSFGANRGRLYCVYATNDPPGSGNKPNIYCHHSDDGGLTWSARVLVNDDLNTQNNHQWAPAIWCDKATGRLYIQWMDTREDPSSTHALIYATYSDDGGETFETNQAISNEPMVINCSTCGGGGTPRYQGDYNGIVSNSNVSMATWSDFRDGHFDSYVSYFPDYSMFLSPETLPVSGSDTLWVQFPEVKLYTGTVIVTAQVETPGAGTITLSYPNGTFISNLPGEIPIVVTASPEVPTGSYQIQVNAKGPNGTPYHKRTGTIAVQPLGPPVANFSADPTNLCAGNGANFTDMTANGPSEWLWSFPGGDPATSTDQNPSGIVYSTPGKYNVTLISSNVAGSDTITKTDYISVFEVPAPPTGDNVTVCASGNIPDLYAEGDNVEWYTDPELTNLVYSGNTYATGITEPGIYVYYVTQTLGDCPSEPAVIVLTINAIPEVTLLPFDPICQYEGAVELSGGTPEGGEYSGTGVVNGYFDPYVSGTGTFDIVYSYSDTNGCMSSAMEQFTVYEVPSVSLGEDSDICEGTSTTLDAGAGMAAYLWNTGATDQTITVTESGEYWVKVTNESGCEDADTVTVSVLPLPTQAATPAGQAIVDYFIDPSTDYTSEGAEYALDYEWKLEPVGAGNVIGDGTSATVEWAAGYVGVAVISLKGMNECGDGAYSGTFEVQVYTSQGVEENAIGQIRVYPNPNKGTFNLEISTEVKKTVDIQLTNALGEVVYRKEGLKVNGDIRETIKTGLTGQGMLILRVTDGKSTWQGKVFVEN